MFFSTGKDFFAFVFSTGLALSVFSSIPSIPFVQSVHAAHTGAVCAVDFAPAFHAEERAGYAIVFSDSVKRDSAWFGAVEALESKYADKFQCRRIVWNADATEALDALKAFQPRYVCFVAKPDEVGREFVISVHQMLRKLDDDPFTDAVWGIVTGFDATDAQRMARVAPTTVRRAAGGTSIPLEFFESGVWYDEGKARHWVEKEQGKEPADRTDGPSDTTRALADAIDSAQLVVSSAHATEKDWQLGYSYRNGCFQSQNGEFFGVPTDGEKFPIRSSRSKIWLASGNCLIGHISDMDCMTLAMIHSLNVDMAIGYTTPTWFGFMGWGILDYYVEQPGRFTLAEAFFANNQALTHHLEALVPGLSVALNAGDGGESLRRDPELAKALKKVVKERGTFLRGLIFDQNVVALYGDPAWENALASRESGWTQTLESKPVADGGTLWVLTVTPLRGEDSFTLVNGNGSQRGGRPIFEFLPRKVSRPVVIQGEEFAPIVADDFVLLPFCEAFRTKKSIVIQFKTD